MECFLSSDFIHFQQKHFDQAHMIDSSQLSQLQMHFSGMILEFIDGIVLLRPQEKKFGIIREFSPYVRHPTPLLGTIC